MLTASSRSIWVEIFSSCMLSFSIRMVFTAASPSAIILSSSTLPVDTGSSGISTVSVTSRQNIRAISATTAEAAAASRKCPTAYSGNSSAYSSHVTAAA